MDGNEGTVCGFANVVFVAHDSLWRGSIVQVFLLGTILPAMTTKLKSSTELQSSTDSHATNTDTTLDRILRPKMVRVYFQFTCKMAWNRAVKCRGVSTLKLLESD